MRATPSVLAVDANPLSTAAFHVQAVEQAIQTMHSHFHEALSLEDLADAACLSPYYFNRVFRRIIGIPPVEFLAALRLQKARHLLLTTSLSVTDICFDVGYTSTGTFTTRFTQQAGLSPRLLRQQAREFDLPFVESAGEVPILQSQHAWRNVLSGEVSAPEDFRGVIYLGLFPRPLPQGRPVRCTRLYGSGRYLLGDIPDGVYYLLSAAFPLAGDCQSYCLPGERLLLGRAQTPLIVRAGLIFGEPDVVLRSPRLTDPPLVMALPFL